MLGWIDYTTEPAANIDGGYEQGSTYLHNLNAQALFDLDKLMGVPKTTFFIRGSSRVGESLSQKYVAPALTSDGRYAFGYYYDGSQQAIGGRTTKLVNVQLTTSLSDSLKIDYGRVVMDDIFLHSEVYCDFMNNAVCGSPKSIFTPYALNAYPNATFGAAIQWDVTEPFSVIAGVFDGSWNDINDRNGLDWTMGKNGTAYTGEVRYYFERGDVYGEQKVLKIGVNHNTGRFEKLTGGMEKGTTTTYMQADIGVYSEAPGQGLSIAGSYAHDDKEELSALPDVFMVGAVYKGLIPGRDRDRIGISFTHAHHSKHDKYMSDFVPGQTRSAESAIEISYNFVLPYGIQVMPDFQYIENPNGQTTFSHASVIGLKININF